MINSIDKITILKTFIVFLIFTVLGIPLLNNIFSLLPYVYDEYGNVTIYLGMYKGLLGSIFYIIISLILNKFS